MATTKRQAAVKVTLSGSSDAMVEAIAKGLYGIDIKESSKNVDDDIFTKVDDKVEASSQKWNHVDENYTVAKAAYDGILSAFRETPAVFKFKSLKDRAWKAFVEKKANEDNQIKLDQETRIRTKERMDKIKTPRKDKSKKRGERSGPIKASSSFLNPFIPPPPWEIQYVDGQVTYFNNETFQRMHEKPLKEIWSEKLDVLEKLTPRDDYNGFAYRETPVEKRKRIRYQKEYDEKLKNAIEKRLNEPSELELIEDTLYDIVNEVSVREETEAKTKTRILKFEERQSWHDCASGYHLRPLPTTTSDDGKVLCPVTNIDFPDIVITPSGHMLACSIPAGLLELHARERQVLLEILREMKEKEELERNRPLKEKLAVVIDLAKTDRRAAIDRAKLEINHSFSKVPGKLRSIRQYAVETGSAIVHQGVRGLLAVSSADPKQTLQKIKNKLKTSFDKFAIELASEEERTLYYLEKEKEQEQLMEELELKRVFEEEAAALQCTYVVDEHNDSSDKDIEDIASDMRETSSASNRCADSVQITMTFLLDPPPSYEWKVPADIEKKWTSEASRAAAAEATKLGEFIRSGLSTAMRTVVETKSNIKITKTMSASYRSRVKPLPPLVQVDLDDYSRSPIGLKELELFAGIGGKKYASVAREASLPDTAPRGSSKRLNQKGGEQDGVVDAAANGSMDVASTRDQAVFNDAPEPVYDDSARVAFEKRLTEELAQAVGVSSTHILLEEVRRLGNRHPNIVRLKQQHDFFLREESRIAKMYRVRQIMEMERRALLAEGKFDEEIWLDRFAKLEASALVDDNLLGILGAASSTSDAQARAATALVSSTVNVGPTSTLKSFLQQNFNVSNSSEREGVDEEDGETMLKKEQLRYRFGDNPENIMRDPSYWLAKDSHDHKSEQARLLRMERLQRLRNEETPQKPAWHLVNFKDKVAAELQDVVGCSFPTITHIPQLVESDNTELREAIVSLIGSTNKELVRPQSSNSISFGRRSDSHGVYDDIALIELPNERCRDMDNQTAMVECKHTELAAQAREKKEQERLNVVAEITAEASSLVHTAASRFIRREDVKVDEQRRPLVSHNHNDAEDLWGCEVSFLVFINNEQKQQLGFEDLEAEDVAVFLREQLRDPSSRLRAGALTRFALDVSYTISSRQRVFETWESFWVHLLHPVFFFHSAKKSSDKSKKKEGGVKIGSVDVPDNILVLSPLDRMSAESREALDALDTSSTEVSKANKQEKRRQSAVFYMKSVENGDEPKLYRPTLRGKVSQVDLERLRRVHKAFELACENALKKGQKLTNSQSLYPQQYHLMKQRDTAYRIYRTAKNLYRRQQQIVGDVFTIPRPIIALTEVAPHEYEEWKEEVRAESLELLYERKLEATRIRELHHQDALVDATYGSKQVEMIAILVKNSCDPFEVGVAVNKGYSAWEREKRKVADLTLKGDWVESLRIKHHQSALEIISERARSRKIVEGFLDWTERKAALTRRVAYQRKSIAGFRLGQDLKAEAKNSESALFFSKQEFMEYLEKVMAILEPVWRDADNNSFMDDDSSLNADGLTALDNTWGAVGSLSEAGEHDILPHELALIREAPWIRVMVQRPEFKIALVSLSSLREDKFARNEVVVFSALFHEVGRMYLQALSDVEEAQRVASFRISEAGLNSLNIDSSIDTKMETISPLMEVAKEELCDDVGIQNVMTPATAQALGSSQDYLNIISDETKKELSPQVVAHEEPIGRRKRRYEEGFITAHDHKFIKLPKAKAMFCVTCKEKAFFDELDGSYAEELRWITDLFPSHLDERMQLAFPVLEYQMLQEHELLVDTLEDTIARPKRPNTSVYANVLPTAYADSLRLYGKTFATTLHRMPTCTLPPRIKVQFTAGMTLPYLMSGLAWCDAEGNSILPQSLAGDPGTLSVVGQGDDEEEQELMLAHYYEEVQGFGISEDLDPADVKHDEKHPDVGFMIKCWHMDFGRNKRRFLGRLKIMYEEIRSAEKGFRKYALHPDERMSRVSGSLTLRIRHPIELPEPNASKQTELGDGKVRVVLDISKASNLLPVTKDGSANPYFEIFWRGPGRKFGRMANLRAWVKVGETPAVQNSLNPVFFNLSKKEEWVDFTMPPVWVDAPQRIPDPDAAVGLWTASNNVPKTGQQTTNMLRGVSVIVRDIFAMDDADCKDGSKECKDGEDGDEAEDNGGGILASTMSHTDMVEAAAMAALQAEGRRRLEMTRLLVKWEDKERRFMAREDQHMKLFVFETSLQLWRPYLDEQTAFSRQFTTMLQNISEPSALLQRARFLHGEVIDGGGLRILCADPAKEERSGRLEVFVTPILYPDDEATLTRSLQLLLGKSHLHLCKLIEYSGYHSRFYPINSGFQSVDERVIISAVEKPVGCTVLEYIVEKWNSITDAEFRAILKQIVSGLLGLHEEGIVHRNFSPACVIIQQVAMTAAATADANLRSMSLNAVQRPLPLTEHQQRRLHQRNRSAAAVAGRVDVVCKVGDYFFLHNPRRTGCEYSLGRADWGLPNGAGVMPPEVLKGDVQQKSDIYAFGMCVFFWATAGQCSLQQNAPLTLPGIEALWNKLPRKWQGTWLQGLLRKCLQPMAYRRPSAEELVKYLSMPFK